MEDKMKAFNFIFISVFLIVILILPFDGQCQFRKVGVTGLQFLKINPSARSIAMGEANTANELGINAIFWNPAGLTQGLGTHNLALTHISWIADIDYNAGAYALNLGSYGVFGVSYVSLGTGDMEETTFDTEVAQQGTGRMFSAGDLAAGLTYAKQFTDKFSAGATVKYIREKLDDYDTDAWAFDVGTLYWTGFKSLRLAMSARNFGLDMRIVAEEKEGYQFHLPLVMSIGLGMDLLDTADSFQRLTVGLEVTHPNDYEERGQFGAEYSLYDILDLRGGYKINYDEQGFSAGAGLRFDVVGMKLILDYAYLDFGRLQSVNVLNLSMSF